MLVSLHALFDPKLAGVVALDAAVLAYLQGRELVEPTRQPQHGRMLLRAGMHAHVVIRPGGEHAHGPGRHREVLAACREARESRDRGRKRQRERRQLRAIDDRVGVLPQAVERRTARDRGLVSEPNRVRAHAARHRRLGLELELGTVTEHGPGARVDDRHVSRRLAVGPEKHAVERHHGIVRPVGAVHPGGIHDDGIHQAGRVERDHERGAVEPEEDLAPLTRGIDCKGRLGAEGNTARVVQGFDDSVALADLLDAASLAQLVARFSPGHGAAQHAKLFDPLGPDDDDDIGELRDVSVNDGTSFDGRRGIGPTDGRYFQPRTLVGSSSASEVDRPVGQRGRAGDKPGRSVRWRPKHDLAVATLEARVLMKRTSKGLRAEHHVERRRHRDRWIKTW